MDFRFKFILKPHVEFLSVIYHSIAHGAEKIGHHLKRCLDFFQIRRFVANTKGVSAIQFAILAPIFILAMIAGVQIGIVLIIENALEGAAREASRYAIVDANDSQGSNILQAVGKTAQDLSGGIIRPENLFINIKAYDEISDMGRPEPYDDTNGDGQYNIGETYDDMNGNGQWDEDRGDSGSFGKPGAAVVYEIGYTYDTIIPIFNFSPLVDIKARTVVVNEDYIESPPAPQQAPEENPSAGASFAEWALDALNALFGGGGDDGDD